jgi:hypothetical protein
LKVAKHIPQRNDAQCRLKWVNVLSPEVTQRQDWTLDEDSKLQEAVAICGMGKWAAVSKMLKDEHGVNRTRTECRNRMSHLNKDGLAQHYQVIVFSIVFFFQLKKKIQIYIILIIYIYIRFSPYMNIICDDECI